MEKLYIISTCLKQKNDCSEFHFKGFYKGEKIKKVIVSKGKFKLNENYLVKIKRPIVKQQVLYAECVKLKKLFS